jgi:hypothetical protein
MAPPAASWRPSEPPTSTTQRVPWAASTFVAGTGSDCSEPSRSNSCEKAAETPASAESKRNFRQSSVRTETEIEQEIVRGNFATYRRLTLVMEGHVEYLPLPGLLRLLRFLLLRRRFDRPRLSLLTCGRYDGLRVAESRWWRDVHRCADVDVDGRRVKRENGRLEA